MKKIITAAIFGIAAATAIPAAAYAADPVSTGRFNNVAAGGYDVVSFFSGEGVEGSADFSTTYQGAEFHFASAESLATFVADPDAYAPQYGGYCAWAVANGKLAWGNPKNANIVDGKLYLNYNDGIEKKWLADIDGFITKADAEWPEILN
ncbi:YHS domain-containing protein [Parvularcula sp. ZS-1/3]|uniref:YHS domain-containing protein n=1 Tax=Parvularcula mediterranea TaxID=2732508 RepID=A0A7Y3RNQ6_9PROT|nr:YHS domain-containing (seleno)protein [Parvularcula mediterranea]NNU17350.1 YHS domain-containing protein [Parvularcula mediterranea]